MRKTGAVVVGLIAILTVVVGSAAPAHAQVGESIQRYQTQITIEQSGDLRVIEQIVYDFGATPRHGVVREIPTRFHYDNRDDRLEPLSDVEVTGSAGTPTQAKVSTNERRHTSASRRFPRRVGWERPIGTSRRPANPTTSSSPMSGRCSTASSRPGAAPR